MTKSPTPKNIASLTHDAASRINVPTAEMAALFEQQQEILGETEREMAIPRPRPLAAGAVRERDGDLDPQIIWNGVKIRITREQMKKLAETGEIEIGDAQLVWRGKDRADWSDLVVNAPPIYVQEKLHPKAIIDDLKRMSKVGKIVDAPDLFADFNGLADPEARAEFYAHSQHWTNRMILGDSMQVMASLAEREGLRAKVQCIYFDPPYGIKFNSNWQVSTLSNKVTDGKAADVTREPEQVKAFRDTWKDGIHSYLTYLRDRLMVARELLTESGSIFVQIGDENVHRVRAVMDEVFGEDNFVSLIAYNKTSGFTSGGISNVCDFIVWYSKDLKRAKFRKIGYPKTAGDSGATKYRPAYSFSNLEGMPFDPNEYVDLGDATSSDDPTKDDSFFFRGRLLPSPKGLHFKSNPTGMKRVDRAMRLAPMGNGVRYVRKLSDFGFAEFSNLWTDIGGIQSRTDPKVYVVQTSIEAVKRCVLMTTDPGDLALDPTCGSGTTATVAEQWGRRWITIDTSRVALALARTRLMSARYPYYLLKDSTEGVAKEQALTGKIQSAAKTHGDIRQGFVYERAPHIMLEVIANDSGIDVIWEHWQAVLEPIRVEMNAALSTDWQEWQIPRATNESWPESVRKLHAAWWEARIARQKEIDASIARAADVEYLYDRPYEDKARVRVAGPFTVESLSPHRVMTARDDTLGDELLAQEGALARLPKSMVVTDFGEMVLENLRASGVQQQDKAGRITFSHIEPWPGTWLSAIGTYSDGSGTERRAGILIGPEFGTLTRSQITAGAREAADARLDALIACAFNFDAQATDLTRLGPLAILKARMNPDLHMADDLKNTGKGNLFVVFGEPDVELKELNDGKLQVKVLGVDVFDPSNGEIRSDGIDGIAAWFIDSDYNEESFFVRHAYFLGAARSGDSDPYKSLKTALRAEIDEEAWSSLYSDVSRPFERPSTGRIAVKVINHFGDEVLKVFGV
jgi:adenine-specific DNA-methyltransferase